MSGAILAVVIGTVVVVFLTQIKKGGKYSNLRINLGRVYCPKCNQKQPIVRKPANERQVLYGSHTCKKCNTEMDKYGKKLS